jgi:hypothetical protein
MLLPLHEKKGKKVELTKICTHPLLTYIRIVVITRANWQECWTQLMFLSTSAVAVLVHRLCKTWRLRLYWLPLIQYWQVIVFIYWSIELLVKIRLKWKFSNGLQSNRDHVTRGIKTPIDRYSIMLLIGAEWGIIRYWHDLWNCLTQSFSRKWLL